MKKKLSGSGKSWRNSCLRQVTFIFLGISSTFRGKKKCFSCRACFGKKRKENIQGNDMKNLKMETAGVCKVSVFQSSTYMQAFIQTLCFFLFFSCDRLFPAISKTIFILFPQVLQATSRKKMKRRLLFFLSFLMKTRGRKRFLAKILKNKLDIFELRNFWHNFRNRLNGERFPKVYGRKNLIGYRKLRFSRVYNENRLLYEGKCEHEDVSLNNYFGIGKKLKKLLLLKDCTAFPLSTLSLFLLHSIKDLRVPVTPLTVRENPILVSAQLSLTNGNSHTNTRAKKIQKIQIYIQINYIGMETVRYSLENRRFRMENTGKV